MRSLCGSLLIVVVVSAAAADRPPVSSADRSVDVLTQHNDTDRTGWNPHEATLTPAAVAGGTFGKLFDLPVDGLIYAQPLVVSSVDIDGARHDIVLVATAHNSLYAFDAESGAQLWHENYGPTIPTPNRFWNTAWGVYLDLTPEVGITSTPVVDRQTMTIYFTTVTWQSAHALESRRERIWDNDAEAPVVNYYLHAVDLRTHQERPGAPVRIEGSVPLLSSHAGRHAGAARLTFNPMQHLQRPGLLLVKGRIVLGFGGHADQVPYQGWVFAYDASDLTAPPWTWSSMAGGAVTQVNGSGVWQAGMGLTADAAGNVYLVTGNGNFDPSAEQFGDSVVKLSLDGGLTRTDSFTPCNQACLDATDGDLGSSGLLHLPGTDLVLLGGKLGRIFVLNTKRLGAYVQPRAARCSTACSDPRVFQCPNPNVVQEFQEGCDVAGNVATIAPVTPCSAALHQGTAPPGDCPPLIFQLVGHHIHGAPVYWRGNRRGPAIYVWSENDVLRAFPFNAATGRFSAIGCAPRPPALAWAVGHDLSPSRLHYGMTGGMLSISSDGGAGGIVWATTPTNNDANQRVVPGILRAYDATDLRHELWNSYQVRDRDDFGNFAKHAPPVVANGKVFVATFSHHLSVYGLHAPVREAERSPLLRNGDFEDGAAGWTFDGPARVNDAFPYWGNQEATLCPLPGRDVRVWQEVEAPATGTYVLTAMLATDIRAGNVQAGGSDDDVMLGADVDGKRVGESRGVEAFAGYQRHEVRFTAQQGGRIRVWYYAPRAAPLPYFGITPADAQPEAYAVIDTVALASPR
jgi:outer membrane protein assembly factor BamB